MKRTTYYNAFSESISDEIFDFIRSKPKEVAKYLRKVLRMQEFGIGHWQVIVDVDGESHNPDLIKVFLRRNNTDQHLFCMNKSANPPFAHYYNKCTCGSLEPIFTTKGIIHDMLVHEIDDYLNRTSKIARFISKNFED